MLKIEDSRGNPSSTLFWVTVAAVVFIVRFAVGGLFGIPVMTGVEFAAGFGSIMGIYQAREYIDKTKAPKNET